MAEAMRKNALKIMDLLPKGARGVETGAHAGRATRALLDRLEPRSLVAIDPWAEHDESSRALAFTAKDKEHAAAKAEVEALAADHPELTLRAGVSAAHLRKVARRGLDWAWLDGGKHYDTLTHDLETLASYISPGGVIAGGGYFWSKILGIPVRAAVKDFVERVPGAELHQEGQFWAIKMPEKITLNPVDRDPSYLVISTMKNEAPYILEWVAHNRAIGFTDFLIFTNDCDDTTDPILQRLTKLGVVQHQANEVLRRGPHKSALKYAKDHVLTLKADWILICDVDEFITVKVENGTVQGLLKQLGPETDIVPFPWKVFGHGGVVDFKDKPITQQFIHCEPGSGRGKRDVKTLFRHPKRMYHFGLHRPRVADEWKAQTVWKSPSGEDISEKMNKGSTWVMKWKGCEKTAYMAHYPVRSVEAYILKKNRGRANHVNEDLGMDYWNKWDMSGAIDRALRRGHPAFEGELKALKADKELRKLHKKGVKWHKEQFATLIQDPRYLELYETLKSADQSEDAA